MYITYTAAVFYCINLYPDVLECQRKLLVDNSVVKIGMTSLRLVAVIVGEIQTRISCVLKKQW